MSGGRVKRQPSKGSSLNDAEEKTLSTNERILKEAHNLYMNEDHGLITIAESLGLELLAPRKKITILLIGNHSAGKSTFINWYIEEHVQKTSVAIETQGFTLVASGRKRESLTGTATLHLYPYLKPLAQIDGVINCLSTEISSSKQKKFPLITFIDTPGLVDGDMVYPFDVNKAIIWLGDLADLILVFFDPIGQALCRRTLNIVEQLNQRHSDRIRFFLSKTDEAGSEADRQVLMQIVQELCKRPGLNRAGFDMKTIYIPNESICKESRALNQINELCTEIEQCIDHTIQKTLNAVETDCDAIAEVIEEKLVEDRVNQEYNWRAKVQGTSYAFLLAVFPSIFLWHFLVSFPYAERLLSQLFDIKMLHALRAEGLPDPVAYLHDIIPKDLRLYTVIACFMIVIILWFLMKRSFRLKSTLNRKHRRQLVERREHVHTYIRNLKHCLYQEYLDQSVTET